MRLALAYRFFPEDQTLSTNRGSGWFSKAQQDALAKTPIFDRQ